MRGTTIAATTLAITPASLSTATVGQHYAPVHFGASGGSGSYDIRLAPASHLPRGLTLRDGVLTGTPRVAGKFSIVIMATDDMIHAVSSRAFSLTIDPALKLRPVKLPVAMAGNAWSVQLVGAGGSGQGYHFTAANLPAWLTLSSTGLVNGTPPNAPASRVKFTITLMDSNHAHMSRTYSLNVHAALRISPAAVPVATVGNRFRMRLHAIGGSGRGYHFTASGLPAWLTLSTTGVLSGTPTTASHAPLHFGITVTDSTSATARSLYALTTDPPVTVSSSSLPSATVGEPYHVQLSATGGSGKGYTFKARGLPREMSLSTGGMLSGMPTSSVPRRFVVTVTDSNRAAGKRVYSLTANRGIVVASGALPVATALSIYRVQLGATGGSGTGYHFAAAGLPAWLTLSPAGLLIGTPSGTVVTRITFSVTVTDSSGATGTANEALVVDPVLSIAPGTLPAVKAGVAYSFQLTAAGGSGVGYRFAAIGLPPSLTLSTSGVLSGTVATDAASPLLFSATLTDSTGANESVTYSLPVETLAKDVVNAAQALFRTSVYERTIGHRPDGNDVEASGQVDWVMLPGSIDRSGECFQFVAQALAVAGAQEPPNLGPDSDYIWGTQVAAIQVTASSPTIPAAAFANLKPGDVIQFRNVAISTAQGKWSFPHHTALIVGVGQTKGINNGTITVLEQNFNNQQFVTEETMDLTHITAGKAWVYAPLAA
jgi:hypothetical protein